MSIRWGKKLRTIDLNRNFLIPCAQMVSEFLFYLHLGIHLNFADQSVNLFFPSPEALLLRIKSFQKAAYKPENTLGKPPMHDLLIFYQNSLNK